MSSNLTLSAVRFLAPATISLFHYPQTSSQQPSIIRSYMGDNPDSSTSKPSSIQTTKETQVQAETSLSERLYEELSQRLSSPKHLGSTPVEIFITAPIHGPLNLRGLPNEDSKISVFLGRTQVSPQGLQNLFDEIKAHHPETEIRVLNDPKIDPKNDTLKISFSKTPRLNPPSQPLH